MVNKSLHWFADVLKYRGIVIIVFIIDFRVHYHESNYYSLHMYRICELPIQIVIRPLAMVHYETL